MMMKWTVLSDNRTNDPALETEHGLSIFLETEKHDILLDTGASDMLIRNAERLGKDLCRVDYVFISHGHSDHAGGLKHFMEINKKAKVIVSPDAMSGKFFSKRGNLHSITTEWPEIDDDRLILIDQSCEIADGIRVIAHIPQIHPIPKGNQNLLVKPNEHNEACSNSVMTRKGRIKSNLYVQDAHGDYIPDDFRHELALDVDGLLFTGCAHSGLENILEACPWPVHTVVGGFHLLDGLETEEEIIALAQRLKANYPNTQFYTSHCTGDQVFESMKGVMGEQLQAFNCGFVKGSIRLLPLREEETIAFKEEMQEAFQHGFQVYYKEDKNNQWQVLPDKDFYQSLEADGAEAYEALDADGRRVGGAIIVIDADGHRGELAFLYVKVGVQSKGIGQAIWKTIETLHPETKVWETCTPYFDRRNIHFYINRCGFHAVEFFNEHHPDPNMPEQPNEQREQSDVNIGYAESRERKSEAQFDQEDGLFKFEKRMI